jgi:hypothetical protein
MRDYEIRATKLIVAPEGEQVYSEMCTSVEIKDEAAGEFVLVSQTGRTDFGEVAISPEEWPKIRDAIDRMISQCRGGTIDV